MWTLALTPSGSLGSAVLIVQQVTLPRPYLSLCSNSQCSWSPACLASGPSSLSTTRTSSRDLTLPATCTAPTAQRRKVACLKQGLNAVPTYTNPELTILLRGRRNQIWKTGPVRGNTNKASFFSSVILTFSVISKLNLS